MHLLLPGPWKNCGGPWTPVWSLWSWSACRNQHRGSIAANRLKINNQQTVKLSFKKESLGIQEKQSSYHWSRVELGDDMVEEGCEVGRARFELLDAVKAVTLAVWLKDNEDNIVKILYLPVRRLCFLRICLIGCYHYLLLVWIKIIILSSNDLWDDAGDGRTADCGRGKRILGGKYKRWAVIKRSLCCYTWREATAATRSVASSASGEWQELRLVLGVFFGLGKDDSFKWWPSGEP